METCGSVIKYIFWSFVAISTWVTSIMLTTEHLNVNYEFDDGL